MTSRHYLKQRLEQKIIVMITDKITDFFIIISPHVFLNFKIIENIFGRFFILFCKLLSTFFLRNGDLMACTLVTSFLKGVQNKKIWIKSTSFLFLCQ